MVISHKYRFVFIKTRKTAGTSIEVYLSNHCSKDDVFTPIDPYVDPHVARNHEGFFNHIGYPEVKKKITRDISGYFVFCVERNPWDKMLSYYHMINSRQFSRRISFDDFLVHRDFCSDFSMYADIIENRLLVDHVIDYDNLNNELDHVFGYLNIPFDGDLSVRAKSEYRTDNRFYRDVYTEPQRIIVEEAFKSEIEFFGYSY